MAEFVECSRNQKSWLFWTLQRTCHSGKSHPCNTIGNAAENLLIKKASGWNNRQMTNKEDFDDHEHSRQGSTRQETSSSRVVKHFLQVIITGHEEVSNQIISVERQITSIGQDIIDAVLEGRRHPPKHLTASWSEGSHRECWAHPNSQSTGTMCFILDDGADRQLFVCGS